MKNKYRDWFAPPTAYLAIVFSFIGDLLPTDRLCGVEDLEDAKIEREGRPSPWAAAKFTDPMNFL